MRNCCRFEPVLILGIAVLVGGLALRGNERGSREALGNLVPARFESPHRNGNPEDDEAKSAGPNLIKNGDFKRLAGELPQGWTTNTWGGQAEFSVDQEEGRAAKPCVKIRSKEGADASWSFRVAVKPRTDYRLSAWIKTREVDAGSGLGAMLNLHELQHEGQSKSVTGDSKWVKITTEFNSGDRRSLLVNLLYGGWGQSVGEAWFDDVELIEMGGGLPTMTEAEAYTFFETKVLPILEDNCFECHGDDPETLGGDLALTSRKMILRGGDSGAAVNAESPEQSLLLNAINYQSTYEMPPDGQLPKEDIKTLTTWIMIGMPWKPGTEVEIERSESHVPQVTAETKRFWSFRPVAAVDPPEVKRSDWVRHPIDAFLLAKLEENGLQPAADASRRELIRRAYYDLTGLPPTSAEVARFVEDPSDDAYEKLIDRLLESPHYGEKWGRHWLDLVRYAESNSFERDGTKPFVWRYRDYVIRAFNSDKPYDRFLLEQLAGDELDAVTPESIVATGYYRLGAWDDEPADPKQAQFDDLDDILATTSQTMLGLTVNCARCHDHKIDPIPAEDYYRMLSFFTNIRRYGVRAHPTVLAASVKKIGEGSDPETIKKHEQEIAECIRKITAIEALVKPDFIPVEHEEFQYPVHRIPLVAKRVGKRISQQQLESYKELTKRLHDLQCEPPRGEESALCVKEHGNKAPKGYVLIRGNAHVQGKPVEPGFLSVLSPPEPQIEAPAHGESTGRRLAFARWVTDPAHPLTARVLVNRLWQYHFGRGIVRTSSDFGFQGTPPTHPRLLDWLAKDFVEGGWKIKRMHKQMMMSHAYQMASTNNADAYRQDPENNWFWRFNPRRLSAEEIRDSVLAVTGSINLQKQFGPSIFVTLPREVLAGQSRPGDGWGKSSAADQNRRSIYIHVKRSLKVPILSNFDAADTDFTCPIRFVTTQPTQALGMLNSDFVNQQAETFAALASQLCPDDPSAQVALILSRTVQREPTEKEIRRGTDLLKRWKDELGLEPAVALKYYCLLALNLNEFIYLD